MSTINPAAVLKRLLAYYESLGYVDGELSDRDLVLHNDLRESIDGALNIPVRQENPSLSEETVTDLVALAEQGESDRVPSSETTREPGSNKTAPSSADSTIQRKVTWEHDEISLDYKTRAVAFWRKPKSGKRDFKQTQLHYKMARSERMLYTWEQDLIRGGSKNDKIKMIHDEVVQRYLETFESKRTVHEADIKRWGLEANHTIQLENFCASRHWIKGIKRDVRIKSRKITHFVSGKDEDEEALQDHAAEFVHDAETPMAVYGTAATWNADQSGFVKELHSNRTLYPIGAKRVEVEVQSIDATTHSYTIMPAISADGVLLPKLFITLQERSGKFGPQVEQNMYRPPNLYITCSRSGKMDKKLLERFAIDVFAKEINQPQALLVWDSWPPHKDPGLSARVKLATGISVEPLIIPPKLTRYVQPLDVYFFVVWKGFVRKFWDRWMVEHADLDMHTRDNILRLQSLTHNQFGSPRYREMMRFAWFQCGYVLERPPAFLTPVQFSLEISGSEEVLCDSCVKARFLKCSWCKSLLCLEHFFISNHICYSFVE